MTTIPVVVLAGQSNASLGGVDNRLFELLAQGSNAFEFVKVAVGGTSLFPNAAPDWAPESGELYAQLVTEVRAAIQRVIAAGDTPEVHTLWIQGEADGARSTPAYAAQLTKFIGAYREAIGAPLSDFAISLLSHTSSPRAAQLEVADALSGVRAVETRGYRLIGVHYDKPGREGIAERFFAASGINVPQGVSYVGRHDDTVVTELAGRTEVTGASYLDVTWTQHGEKAASVRTFSGDDSITGGAGDDAISTGDNADHVEGGAGNDLVWAGEHNDFVSGGAGNDLLRGENGDDSLDGGLGRNTLFGGDWNDLITGGGDAFDQVNGNQGEDTIVGRSSVGDWLLGGQGNDRIDASGSTGHNICNGNLGNDTLTGGSGGDILRGGQGDDSIVGGAGSDWITGDLGVNTVTGGAGADTFHASAGTDVVTDFSSSQHDRVQVDPGVAYQVSQVDADVQIDLANGGHLILRNIQLADLKSGWLITT